MFFSESVRSTCLIGKKESERKGGRALGGWGGGGTPGLIPNPVVKPASADGTRGATPRKSRSSPSAFPPFFVLSIKRFLKKILKTIN